MKKLLAIIFTVLLLLSACSEQKIESTDGCETAYHSPRGTSISLNGIFYNDDNEDSNGYTARRLYFYDFDSMQSTILCALPNCLHNDSDTCTAFGIDRWNGYPTVINKKLYFFENTTEWGNDGELLISLNVWKAAADGSSREKIDVISGLTIRDLVIRGTAVYFTAAEENYEDYTGVNTGYVKLYICSYDFEKEEFVNYGFLAEGYNSSAQIYGEYNGSLYIWGSYADKIDDDWHDWNGFYTRLILETGEIAEWDMPLSSFKESGKPKPMFIGGGFYGYMNGDDSVIVDSKGSETVIKNYELSGKTPVNGYLFDEDAGRAINLSSRESLKINTKDFPEYGYVLCYHDGYIIKSEISDSEYVKISEDELFKE